MKLKTSKLLIDTCIWIGYFRGDYKKANAIINSNETNLFTSTISLFEFKRFMLKHNTPQVIIQDMLNSIKELSVIIPIKTEIPLLAAENSIRYNLAIADSLIYTSINYNNSLFVTADKHFSKTPNTLLI